MISGTTRTLVAAGLAALLTTAAPAVGESAVGDTHTDGEGRLSASSGGGGFVVDAPVRRPYWVSVGDWILCDVARDAGATPTDTITITGVRPVPGQRRPLEVVPFIRTVTPEQVAADPRAPRGAYGPYIAALGRPPHFRQQYAESRWVPRGRYSRDVAGTVVDRGCDETSEDASADYRDTVPAEPWQTLVLAVKVGRDGARVPRTLVDYTVGDTPHTLRIRWSVGGQGFRRAR